MKRLINSSLRIVSVVLAIAIISAGCVFADSMQYGDSAAQEATAVLLESGWSQDEIDTLFTEDALRRYKGAELVGVPETKYYKVSEDGIIELPEDECIKQVEAVHRIELMNEIGLGGTRSVVIPIDSSVTTYQTTSGGYLKYRLTVYRLTLDLYLLTAGFEWLITPAARNIEVFGLSTNNYLTVASDEYKYFSYSATITGPNGNTSSYNIYLSSATAVESTDGFAVMFDLKNDYVYQDLDMHVTNHRGVVQVYAYADSGSHTGKVVADYYHNQLDMTVSLSVTFLGDAGISVTPTSVYQRMLQNISQTFSWSF